MGGSGLSVAADSYAIILAAVGEGNRGGGEKDRGYEKASTHRQSSGVNEKAVTLGIGFFQENLRIPGTG